MKKKMLVIVVGLFIMSGAVGLNSYAAEDKTYDQLKLLMDVMGLIQDNYVDKKESKPLIVGAIKGMVKTLDPFSQFMEPEAYKDMTTETQGEFGGLGIRISVKDGWPTVITPMPGTPAYRIGILPDDKIVKIEGKTAHDTNLEDVVNQLRGKPGTKVTISIMREGFKAPVDYTIVRQVIKIETITSKMLDNKVGYIRLTEFSANSDKDLGNALAKLKEQGMKSFIFDLRNNPGGLLDVAVDVCKRFVGDDKLVVFTQGRNPDSRREYRSRGKADYGDLPMVVLVNRGSASASEIVSGCMQDLKRALIVGTTTFGKGSVQSIFPLDDGNALRLTTAKYYTPSGRSIHRDEATGKGGVVPDLIIEVPVETEVKLYTQSEEVYAPGKEPKTVVKDTEIVKDVVLERAKEILRLRELMFPAPKVEPAK